MLKRRILLLSVAAALAAASGGAGAQAYPGKPVRLIVPFAAGGTTDIVARVVSEKIGSHLGQTMIVDNKAGGGGSVGATEVARATPEPNVPTFKEVGLDPVNRPAFYDGNTPEQFATQIAAEFEVYKKVVAAQKLKLE